MSSASFSSITSLYAHTRAIFSDDVDAFAIGREVLDGYWPSALEGMQRIREQLAPGRYADVFQADLRSDPIGALRALYARLELPFDDTPGGVLEGVERFLDEEASGPKRIHVHEPEGFGLSAGEIRERMKGYVEAFDL